MIARTIDFAARETLLWLIGFPLSVVVAAIVVMLPFMISDPENFMRSHIDLAGYTAGDPMLLGAIKIIGAFCLPPAIVVRYWEKSSRGQIWPYVTAGAWTGFCGGLLAMLIPIIVGSAALSQTLLQATNDALLAEDLFAVSQLFLVSLTAVAIAYVAGACGGLVLGFVAKQLDQPS